MKIIQCPECGGTKFNALVQLQGLRECRLFREDDGSIEIDINPLSPFVTEMASEVTTAYMCAKCENAVAPEAISDLEAVPHEEPPPNPTADKHLDGLKRVFDA